MSMLNCLPFNLAIQIYDLLISEGRDVIFQVLMGIFSTYQDEILQKRSFEELKFWTQQFETKCVNLKSVLKWTQKPEIVKRVNELKIEYQKTQV